MPHPLDLEQVAQKHDQMDFERLQRRRLPGQPFPVLCHPQSKRDFPDVQVELTVFQFEPTALCPIAGHH